MTAPRMPRYSPLWRDTQIDIHQATAMPELDATAARCNQVCPPCNGNCQQGDTCPAGVQSDGPRDAGEWSMVAFILLVVVVAFFFGPLFRSLP